ncbi:hypothetical protein KAU33_15690 [Candidatus Dependentiae bacterium]|nr:hypothetical protein [Candidatus Dependentiae bacterium]
MLREYEIEFMDLSEEGVLFEALFVDSSEKAVPFEALFRYITANTNNSARTIFKKEMKEDFGAVEGKDYKIEHVTINKIPFGGGNVEGKDYGNYEIGYKDNGNIFFTGQILIAKTEEDAIDQFMKIEPDLIRENVRANRT